MSDHHWAGETPDPERYLGFVYLITDELTGKAYVGRKNYWIARSKKGCKSRVTDKGSDKWKPECWKASDWEYYKGSSKALRDHMRDHADHEYSFVILKQVQSKGRLSYEECKEQWKRDVLCARLPDETYRYLNGNIQAIRFRPKKEEQKND